MIWIVFTTMGILIEILMAALHFTGRILLANELSLILWIILMSNIHSFCAGFGTVLKKFIFIFSD